MHQANNQDQQQRQLENAHLAVTVLALCCVLFFILWLVNVKEKRQWKAEAQTAQQELTRLKPELRQAYADWNKLNNRQPPDGWETWLEEAMKRQEAEKAKP